MVKSDLENINNSIIKLSVNDENIEFKSPISEISSRSDKNTIKNLFFQELEKLICLDVSRKNFAEDTFIHLYELVTGIKQKYRYNGYRRLLLGRKGVGKTILLKSMQNISENIFKDLFTIYCDLGKNVILPSTLIAKKLSIQNIKDIDIEDLEHELKKQNKYIFIVYDELQNVFSNPSSEDCKKIINELHYIGGSQEGRIHCIITGSSCDLRRLCFAKLKKEEICNFPNYTNQDLNSTKFSARWIFPFLSKNDFIEFVRRLPQNESVNEKYQEFLLDMYLQTSGNPRLITEFNSTNSCDSYTYTLKNIDQDNENFKILKAIFQIVKDLEEKESIHQDLSLDLNLCEKWTLLFRIEWLNERLGINVPISMIYDLADKGYIRYLDIQKQVGIGSPTIFLQLLQQINDKSIDNILSYESIMALKYPFGKLKDIAENLALKYLAKSSEKWLSFKLLDDQITNLDITKIKEDEIKFIYLHMFKELYDNRDALGADSIVINLDTHSGIMFHRIQIKLGTKLMESKDAQDIINRFKQNEKNFLSIWQKNIECNKNNIIYYLATTRFINKDAENILQSNNIKILNSEYLAKNIWPEEVRNLGKPYSFKK